MNVKFRFRSKSSDKVFNASQVCVTGQSVFYNIVLSHGDGSIKNYPILESVLHAEQIALCKSKDLSNFENDDPIAFCICRYIDLFTTFYLFSLGSGFNVKNR